MRVPSCHPWPFLRTLHLYGSCCRDLPSLRWSCGEVQLDLANRTVIDAPLAVFSGGADPLRLGCRGFSMRAMFQPELTFRYTSGHGLKSSVSSLPDHLVRICY
jgi:hypothetical protein